MTRSNSNIENGQVVDKMDKPISKLILLIMPFYAGGLIVIAVFPLSGDWLWVEGWALVALVAVYTLLTFLRLNKKNPRVLRNRLKLRKEKKMGEKRSKKASESDKFILPIIGLFLFLIFLISDLDHRYDWSGTFLVWLEVAGFIMTGFGLYIIHLSNLQNAYASKVLDIREGQHVIDTGLYAHIRHPLYSGMLGLIMGIPFCLGSWWGLLPAVACSLVFVLRIKYEEEMLITGLDGYTEYRERVKHKLIPKIF